MVAWLTGQAQPQLLATASRYAIGLNQDIRVQFACNASGRNFVAPDWNADWTVLAGPSVSQSTTIVQGQMRIELAYQFVVRPKRTGTLTIGPAHIQVNGAAIASKPLQIEVAQADPSDQESAPKAPAPALYRIEASRNSVYVGEPLLLDYVYYTQGTVQQVNARDDVEWKGYYKRELDIPNAGKQGRRTLDGIPYQWSLEKRFMVIPQIPDAALTGALSLEGVALKGGYARDPFGWPMQKGARFSDRRPAPSIQIKPLPERDRPADFSGAVGQYTLSAALDTERPGPGSPVKLRVEVKGQGNLGLVELERPELPALVESFEPERGERLNLGSNGFSGSKWIEILLIPRHKGVYTIPSISFSYFDPQKATYVVLKSEPLQFELEEGSTSEAAPAGAAKESVTTLAEDIRYVRKPSGKSRSRVSSAPLWWGTSALLMLGLVVGALGRARVRRTDTPKERWKKQVEQSGILSKRGPGPTPEVALELIGRYCTEVAGISAAEFNQNRARTALLDHGLDPAVVDQLLALKMKLESLRYSGASTEGQSAQWISTFADLCTKL